MTTQVDDRVVALRGRPAWRGSGSWPRFLLGFLLLYAVLATTSALDATGRWGLAILACVLVSAIVVERFLFGAPVSGSLVRLGLGRPSPRAVAAAAVVSALVLLVYPISFALSGDPVRLRSDWVWLLIGLFAFHGLAEELVWRGFAFRRLREGRSFRSALWWTMPLIAATHIPIVVSLGVAVGVGAMAVAAVTSIPFGYLYETGGNTIWAPALVHTAIDSFKLMVIPAAALTALPALLIGAGIAVPLLVLLLPRGFLEGGTPSRWNSATPPRRSDGGE